MNDLQRLAAACRREPDCDTARGALADCLDEHGEYEHAEIIRVQCELAKHPRRVVLDSDADGKGVLLSKRGGPDYYELPWETAFYYCLKVGDRVDVLRRKGDNDPKWLRGLRVTKVNSDEDSDTILRRDAESGPDPVAYLRRRESALLAALDRCRPKCPACKGTKLAPDSEQVGNVPVICSACLHPSELCSTGHLPLTWHRGGASCRVPRLEDVWAEGMEPNEDDKGGRRVWQLTPLGRELAALPLLVGVECLDRVPHWNGGWYTWHLIGRPRPSSAVPESAEVPGFIFERIRTTVYKVSGRMKGENSPDAARAALAAAVAESLMNFVL